MIGNSKLHQILRNGRQLSDNKAWFEVMNNMEMKEFILNRVRRDQLIERGIDSEGNVIGLYSKVTEIISKGIKVAGTHYTLYDDGDLQRTLYVAVFLDKFIIIGDVRKIEDQKWFSEKILGLTDENISKIREKAKIGYIEYFKKTLFKSV